MNRLWRSNSSISSKTSCPPDIVNDEDHNVEKHGASALMCLHNAKSKNFKDSIFCMANVHGFKNRTGYRTVFFFNFRFNPGFWPVFQLLTDY